MIIVSDNYTVVKNSLLRALDIIEKSNDIEKIISSYIAITDFYEDIQLSPKLKEVHKRLNYISRTDRWSLAQSSQQTYLSTFEAKINSNIEYYYNLFKDQTKIIEGLVNSLHEDENYTQLSDDEIYNVLTMYLGKNDSRLLELFNDYIKRRNILKISVPFYLGNASASPILDDIYVKVRNKNTFEDLMTILHEMSHAKIFEDVVQSKDCNSFNKLVCTNLYMEVYPRLQEINFLLFLIDNNILVNDAKKDLVRWLLFYNRLLVKNLELYEKNKQFNYCDIRDIISFLYRDLLISNGISINNQHDMEKTINEQFYTDSFDIDDINKSTISSTEKIKKLVM